MRPGIDARADCRSAPVTDAMHVHVAVHVDVPVHIDVPVYVGVAIGADVAIVSGSGIGLSGRMLPTAAVGMGPAAGTRCGTRVGGPMTTGAATMVGPTLSGLGPA